MRGLPTLLQETGKPLDNFAHIPFLILILTECDDVRVESALLKRILQLIELVLVLVESELLHLGRRIQRFDKLLKLAALECLTGQEVNANEGLRPALALIQFIGSRYRLLDDLEGMPAISDSKLRFAILKVLELIGVDSRNGDPQRLVLVVYLEFVANVDDSAILPMEGRGLFSTVETMSRNGFFLSDAGLTFALPRSSFAASRTGATFRDEKDQRRPDHSAV